MLVPKLFSDDFFDHYFDGFRNINQELFDPGATRAMLMDVKDMDDHYDVEIDLPGFKKENIHIELDNGYLNITAKKDHQQEEKDDQDKIIRQERYYGTMSRRFYVGNDLKADDISGKFQDGVLTLTIPKKEDRPKLENPNRIEIE